jgi:hypothetical protein
MAQLSLRIFIDVSLIVLAFIVPWWASFMLVILFAFIFQLYFEFFVVSAILYGLYYSLAGFSGVLLFALVPLLFIGIEFSKKYLIFYHYE